MRAAPSQAARDSKGFQLDGSTSHSHWEEGRHHTYRSWRQQNQEGSCRWWCKARHQEGKSHTGHPRELSKLVSNWPGRSIMFCTLNSPQMGRSVAGDSELENFPCGTLARSVRELCVANYIRGHKAQPDDGRSSLRSTSSSIKANLKQMCLAITDTQSAVLTNVPLIVRRVSRACGWRNEIDSAI